MAAAARVTTKGGAAAGGNSRRGWRTCARAFPGAAAASAGHVCVGGGAPMCVLVVAASSGAWRQAAACDGGQRRQVHLRAVKSRVFADACIGNGFVRLYAELRVLEDAWKVFDCMSQRDSMSWNALLGCYMKSGEAGSCLQEFLKMVGNGIRPDECTFAVVLNDLAERLVDLEAVLIHSEIVRCNAGEGCRILDCFDLRACS